MIMFADKENRNNFFPRVSVSKSEKDAIHELMAYHKTESYADFFRLAMNTLYAQMKEGIKHE